MSLQTSYGKEPHRYYGLVRGPHVEK